MRTKFDLEVLRRKFREAFRRKPTAEEAKLLGLSEVAHADQKPEPDEDPEAKGQAAG